MRPRVFPAEDLPTKLPPTFVYTRFNEAAGIPRGRLAAARSPVRSLCCFNEAAGIPRGRPKCAKRLTAAIQSLQ